jgi:nicotinamide riboside transporter PnuC
LACQDSRTKLRFHEASPSMDASNMTSSTLLTALGWICYASGAVAIVIYVINIFARNGWRRPWNAAGLFFTAIAASQIPSLFREVDLGVLRVAFITTVCLVAITGLQGVTAMRRRRERRDAAPATVDTAPVAPELEAQ